MEKMTFEQAVHKRRKKWLVNDEFKNTLTSKKENLK